MKTRILTRGFFARPTLEVAPGLIGAVLHVRSGSEECSGRIVEVEAYLGAEDPASHAARGRTPRSAIMFGPPGVVYIYLVYGMHHCLNFVTEAEGRPGAVLVRALEPLTGRGAMARRRGLDPAHRRERDLTAGPGRLCAACGIDLDWNGLPLTRSSRRERKLWVDRDVEEPVEIEISRRIGIRRAVESPYRFTLAGSSWTSPRTS